MAELFPVSEYWWFYLTFVGLVFLLLAVDLGIFHRKAHAVGFREAATWSVVWIALSLLFNLALYNYALWKFPQDARLMAIPGFDPNAAAWRVSLEFLTGYVIEKSLSVDNIFVFVLIFTHFAVPKHYHYKVLIWGVLVAIILRFIFIAAGTTLIHHFDWVLYLFGAFLLFTGVKMIKASDAEPDMDKNIVYRFCKSRFRVTEYYVESKFFTRRDGLLYVTPLFVVLMVINFVDVIFAFDSIPAIFAITSVRIGPVAPSA